MAGNSSRTLKLIFAGDNKGAIQATKGLESGLGGLQSKLGGVGTGLAGIFSVGAITAFGAKAEQTWANTAGAVAKFKRLTGASAEDASALAFYAQQAGIDATKAATGFQFLAKNIQNGKVAAEHIKTIGGDGKLLPFDKILGNISEKFQSLPPGIERTALVLKLFGRGGADMGKILAQGSDELAKQRAQMKALGLSFDKDGLKKYQEFINAQRDAQAAVTGLEVQLGSALAPTLTTVAHATEKVIEGFNGLSGPAKVAAEGGAALVGLAVAAAGLATAVGFLGPALGRTAGYLGLKKAAADAATVAETELTAATAQMALGEAAATASQIAFNDAIALGLPIQEAAAAAAAARAEVLGAEATAAEGAAVAETSLAGALGPVGIALAVAGAAWLAFKHSQHEGITGDPAAILRLTQKQLLELAGVVQKFEGEKGFEKIGAKSLPALRAMRDAVREAGGDTSDLDTAIRRVESTNERAAKAEKKYGDATDKTSESLSRKERALRKVERAEEAQNKKVSEAIDKATQERDAQQGVIDAHQQRIDDENALGVALKAAAGDSDEYRSALDDIASAEKDEVSAKGDVLSAQQDLNQARIDARKNLSDLTDATNKAAEAERDSVLAKHEAEAELRKVLADPRSSALDKERATVGLADAEDNAKQAAKDHTQAILDENAAKAAGVEGDKAVVDAKAKVRDAQDKVRESIDKVAEAQKAARKVLSDAATEAEADSKKVQQDKADEAAAWFNLAKLTNDATGAALIYYALLKQMGADPALQALLAAALNGVNTGLLTPKGQGELGNGRPAPHAPGSPAPTRSLTGGPAVVINQIHQGTPRQVGRSMAASSKRTLDDLFRGTR